MAIHPDKTEFMSLHEAFLIAHAEDTLEHETEDHPEHWTMNAKSIFTSHSPVIKSKWAFDLRWRVKRNEILMEDPAK